MFRIPALSIKHGGEGVTKSNTDSPMTVGGQDGVGEWGRDCADWFLEESRDLLWLAKDRHRSGLESFLGDSVSGRDSDKLWFWFLSILVVGLYADSELYGIEPPFSVCFVISCSRQNGLFSFDGLLRFWTRQGNKFRGGIFLGFSDEHFTTWFVILCFVFFQNSNPFRC